MAHVCSSFRLKWVAIAWPTASFRDTASPEARIQDNTLNGHSDIALFCTVMATSAPVTKQCLVAACGCPISRTSDGLDASPPTREMYAQRGDVPAPRRLRGKSESGV